MREFNFLVKRDNEKEGFGVLDFYENAKALGDRFVVWAPLDRYKYYVFDNVDEYIKYAASLPENRRCFHEVVFGAVHQKFRLDIDAKHHPGTKEEFEVAFDKVKLAIDWAFCSSHGYTLKPADYVVTDSSNASKISRHIIINNYCFQNNSEVERIFNRFIKVLREHTDLGDFEKYIDKEVYKRTQNFRLAGCHKGDKAELRFKRIISTDHELRDSIITYTAGCTVAEIFGERSKPEIEDDSELTEDEVEQATELATGYIDDFEVGVPVGRIIRLTRVSAGYCCICKREHDNENAYMRLNADGRLLFGCHRMGGKGCIQIGYLSGSENVKKSTAPCTQEVKLAKSIMRLDDLVSKARCQNLIQMPDCQEYESETMAPFNSSHFKDVYLVQAAMKMGKTKSFKRYLTENYELNAPNPSRIIVVSFRQTFTSELAKKLKDLGFIAYNTVKGKLTQNRIIVQVESLHRLEITDKKPALLVLDECESILGQFASEHLAVKRAQVWGVFEYLVRCSGKILAMDAHLGSRTVNVIKSIRTDARFHLHRNTFANTTDYICNITTDTGLFMGNLIDQVKQGSRIVIPTNSLTSAEAIKAKLETDLGETKKEIGIFSRKTSAEIKRTECGDVNSHWLKYDVLIYTPTISAGISFEEIHFDAVYAMFTDRSSTVEECMQMLMRVRNLSNKTINIHFSCSGNNLPPEINDIKTHIQNSREALRSPAITDMMTYDYDDEGVFKFYTSPYFMLHLENRRMINLSKNNFIGVMLGYFKNIGVELNIIGRSLSQADQTCNAIIQNDFNEYIKLAANEYCENVMKADDISPEEVDFYKARELDIELGNPVPTLTLDQEYSCKRRQLQDYYSVGPESLTSEFVKRFDRDSVRRRYRELGRILKYDNITAGLEGIRQEDQLHQNVRCRQKSISELTYNLHKFCITFMQMSNLSKFPSDFKGTYVLSEIIMENTKDPNIYSNFRLLMKSCCTDLGIRYIGLPKKPPTNNTICRFIEIVSYITGPFYGLTWTWRGMEEGMIAIKFKAKKEFDIGSKKNTGSNSPYIKTAQ